MRHSKRYLALLAAVFALALAGYLGRRFASRALKVQLSDSGRVTLAPGSFGDLIRATDRVKMRGKVDLKAGRYDLQTGHRKLKLQVTEQTTVDANIDFRIASVGETLGASWVEPQIRTCQFNFSRPIRIGSGPELAVSSLALRSEQGLTGAIEPAYAQTLASILVEQFYGAGGPGTGPRFDRIISNAEIASASLHLKPGAELGIGTSKFVVGPSSSAELTGMRISSRGLAEGRIRAALALTEPSRIEASALLIHPHAARLAFAGTIRIASDGASLKVGKDDGGVNLDVEGGSFALGNAIRLDTVQAKVHLSDLQASYDARSGLRTMRLSLSQGQLDLAGGTKFRLGQSVVTLGDLSILRFKNLEVPGDGGMTGNLVADLSLGPETDLNLHGLRIRPRKGSIAVPIRVRKGADGLRLELESDELAERRPHLALDGTELHFDAKSPVSMQLGRIEARFGKWTYAETLNPSATSSELEISSASLARGSLKMPLGGGSLEVADLAIPSASGIFRWGPGADSFVVRMPKGLNLGRSTWTLVGADGTHAHVESRGLESQPLSATSWRDVAIDLSSIDLKPSKVVLTDSARHSITMDVGDGSALSANGRLVINPADPARSALPALAFKGRKLRVLADLGDARIGLADVDGNMSLAPGGALAISGSLHGRLQGDGLPAGVAMLVNEGRLRADDLKLTLAGGVARVALGRLEVRLPQDQVRTEVRAHLARPFAIPDKALGVHIPEVIKDATAAGMSATIQVPTLNFGRDEVSLDAQADVRGRVDVKKRFRKLSMQMKQFGPIKSKFPVYEERWTDPETLTDFSGTLTAQGIGRFSVVGGEVLAQKRIRIETTCDRAHIERLRIENTIVELVVKAVRAIAGRAIEHQLKKALSQNFEIDPFAKLAPQDHAWLRRIGLKSFSVDAQGRDLVITGSADFR